MQKVYLLLRSNKQTGPYSLEELLQLNLKPFDLVWVNGRSAAWQYPFEIPALKPYVPETPQAQAFQPISTSEMEEKKPESSDSNSVSQPQNPAPQKTETPKRVFVSIPKTYTTTIEQKIPVPLPEQNSVPRQDPFLQHKAYMPPVEEPMNTRQEEVKPIIPLHTYTSQKPVGENPVSTNYSRSLHDVEEDYTKWMYQKKTKNKSSVNPKDLVLAVLILAVISGGYYVMSRPSVVSSVVPSNKVAVQNVQPTGDNAEETESKENPSTEQKTVRGHDAAVTANEAETKSTKIIKTKNPVTVSKSQTNTSVPSVQKSMPVEKNNPNIQNDNGDIRSKEPEVKQQPKETTETGKKKKFGEVLKSIFSKKEKKEEAKNDVPVLEDPKPATNRQSTKREDSPSSANNTNQPAGNNTSQHEINTADLMEQVELSSNAPDSWMMGVKNLKITLKNRSNVTIQTASVTVSYYDENNELMEKKLVYFNNVAPKSKATVAAPDHKFADHVDFKLTTISAKEDRFASN